MWFIQVCCSALNSASLMPALARHFIRPIIAENPTLLTVYLVVAVLHVLANVSLDHCTYLLYGMKALLCLSRSALHLEPHAANANLSEFPLNASDIVAALDVGPRYSEYCCCPKCFHCYPIDSFPDRCTAQDAHDSPICGRTLRHNVHRRGQDRSYAARRYLHHDLKQWMGEVMCRPGVEEMLDRDVFDTGASADEKRDIWDGDLLRAFTGEDGLQFVGKKRKGEGRYVFALNADGFNPFGNKIAGKQVDSGAMYMVCLNLPPHLCHRLENVFLVGIIPGPNKPSLTQHNHFLRPLVNKLLVFWHRGIYYSRTFLHPKGRLVRCALVPVICDLLAARQIMAFAAHSSKHFCCYCGLLLADMDNIEMDTWPPGIQSRQEYVELAEAWRDASTSQRHVLFEKHGVRYTELLRLPYWDPLKFMVIDSMHGLLLSTVRHHCRALWKMDIRSGDGDGLPTRRKRAARVPDDFDMAQAWQLLRQGPWNEVVNLNMATVKRLCEGAHLPTGGKKNKLLAQLRQFVSGTIPSTSEQGVLNIGSASIAWLGRRG